MNEGMNIVFIDDDREDSEFFCDVIRDIAPEATCHVIESCINLSASIGHIGRPDVIFLDGHMPMVSGKECLAILKELVDTNQTKIIIYTGSITAKEESEFIQLGVDAVLRKGTSYEEIKEHLRNAISIEQRYIGKVHQEKNIDNRSIL